MERIMRQMYRNPSSKGSLGGVDRLYRSLRNDGRNVSREKVRNFLQGEDSYTLHKPVRRKFIRSRVVADAPLHHFQMDLCDMQKYQTYNDGVRYLFIIIDVYSRYVWVLPMRNKTSSLTAQIFREYLIHTGNIPGYIATDEGGEFMSNEFKKVLDEFNIGRIYMHSIHKSMLAERVIRTLKEKIYRYFTLTKKFKYIDVLGKIVECYNHSIHKSIGKPPVSKIKEAGVLCVRNKAVKTNKKLKLGDYVRISRVSNIFKKGYTEGWTREIYKIFRISKVTGLHHLVDLNEEKIQGGFYYHEMQKVRFIPNAYYEIEKILSVEGRGRNKKYLVKWLGYPKSFNSYIKASVVKRYIHS